MPVSGGKIREAAQRMADYLHKTDNDPALHFSVPLDEYGGLSDVCIDGDVNLYELAAAALGEPDAAETQYEIDKALDAADEDASQD